ncbi:hypothetical protein JTE90_017901 [Oedothorax gibbosus]|uniref:Uncharacterized protein n=1 Tax=Oedothorax gibbosus TaxID=931172 RepID=A0AAV6VIU3_9ARAC|nr:hypothetical protein JTE90_017901 [Oedothorax gibbosus]
MTDVLLNQKISEGPRTLVLIRGCSSTKRFPRISFGEYLPPNPRTTPKGACKSPDTVCLLNRSSHRNDVYQ